jgi:hypothetical protein
VSASRALESLAEAHALLRDAALEERPLPEVVDAALPLIERAQLAIYAMGDEQKSG